jgi:hypothetical protein
LTVTDGTESIGRILRRGARFFSFALPSRRKLGVFPSMKAASNAISAAHGDRHA